MGPKISIVVPVYNTEPYLVNCLDSCIEQTYKNIEIIVVNDCSPGNCDEILRDYQNRDKRIVYLPLEKNSHVFAAREQGTLIASGEYITYVDSDDWLSPDILEHAVSLLSKYPDGVFFNYLRIEDNGVTQPYYFSYLGEGFIRNPNQPQDEYASSILFQTRHEQGARLLKTEICVKTYQDLNVKHTLFYGEDLLFMAAYLFYAQQCGSISDRGYYYRQHSQSMMNNISQKQQKIKLDNITTVDRNLRQFWRTKGYGYKAFEKGMKRQKKYLQKSLFSFYSIAKKIIHIFRKFLGMEQIINEIASLRSDLWSMQKELEAIQDRQNRISKTLLSVSLRESQPAIFYLGTPENGDLGDQAVAAASLSLLQKLYPGYALAEFTRSDWLEIRPFVIQSIRPEDVIFLHGGGNIESLWANEEELRRSIIKIFPNNPIISVPQHVSFAKDPEGRSQLKLSQDIYNAHPNLTIIGQDELIFRRIKEYFPRAKHILAPDTILFWETRFLEKFQGSPREGILLVSQSNKEKNAASYASIQKIQKYFFDKVPYTFIDMVVPQNTHASHRDDKLSFIFQKFSGSRLVITDSYYGLIFSVLTSTPCIVCKSLDHRISESIKWFSHLTWIHYSPEEEAIPDLIKSYTQNNPIISHTPYFTEKILNIYRNI